MTNILKAIQNLISGHDIHVGEVRESVNRANSLGEAFEVYIKNVFAGAFGLAGTAYQEKIEEAFSYQGSASNPPDLMIRGGDAIEIKKLQTKDSQIQLNSSFPKNKLHIEDSRIAAEAKSAESWTEKDILYVVGNVDARAKTVKSMWWVYGDCLIDEELDSVAERIFLSDALSEEFKKNGEVRVENLGVAGCLSLRFKAEWNLGCLANSLCGNGTSFLNVLMREEKYNSFPTQDRAEIAKLKEEGKIQIRPIVFPCADGRMIACKQIFSAEVVAND